MIYPIVKFGDPVLEKAAADVTTFDDEIKKLVDDMFESMYAARGVGLAAPQIGISKRIAVVDVTFKEDPGAKLVLINPVIVSKEGRQRSSEGCLSIPEFREDVTRAKTVRVRAQDLHGKFFEHTGEDLLARGIEHYAGDQLAFVLQRQRDVVHGKGVGEVGGSIEGIHVPAEVG